MDLSLNGRVAVVTGAASGIGLAISRQLAGQGATVVMVDMVDSVKEQAAALSGEAAGWVLDVTDAHGAQALADALAQRHGRADILVNNAGISPKKGGRKFYLEEISPDDWRRVLCVNLDSMYLMARALVPLMKEKGWGRIINVSSQAGRGRSDLTSAHYATSKAAVLGLTRSMACELGKHGISVTAVAPGFIETAMSDAFSERRRQAVIDSIPARRAGSVEDVACAVGFLSSGCSGYINGAVLDINGGGYM